MSQNQHPRPPWRPTRLWRLTLTAALLGALGPVASGPARAHPDAGSDETIDVTGGGVPGDGASTSPAISADGSVVAFVSAATDLVAGDTNGVADVFVRDRSLSATSRVSVASDGTAANGASHSVRISADGRYVAFGSDATNLVANDLNLRRDVFVHDRLTGQTTLASVAAAGVPNLGDSKLEALSPDGRYVAFSNTTTAGLGTTTVLLLRDRDASSTAVVATGVLLPPGADAAAGAAISDGGRFVAYTSASDSPVVGDANGVADVYVLDRQTSALTIASVSSAGGAGNGASGLAGMSDDGRFVTFTSQATNLVASDTNGVADAFVRDRHGATTRRATLNVDGTERPSGGKALGSDPSGRHVLLDDAGGLVVHDRQTGGRTAEPALAQPVLSADGAHLAGVSGSRVVGHDRGIDGLMGFLRVTTDPPLPSQISVDGIPRASYGLISLPLAPGDHQVCFRDVEGYATPSCQVATVSHGVTTTVTGQFVARGFLQVVTQPALPAAISVDGIARDDWGIYTDLAVGDHQVCFGPVADYAPPGCQTVTLQPGLTTTVTGVYTLSLGAPGRPPGNGFLRVTTSPPLPSQISVDGVARSTWGVIGLELAPGDHQVCFRDVEGYDTPACQTVTVAAGATAEAQGVFTARGFLDVKTSPALPGAVYVDGVARDEWGVQTDLAVGPHQVCFGPVAAHWEPPCASLVVTAGATTSSTGSYGAT